VDQALEVLAQVTVFLRDNPVLQVGLDGELDDGEVAGGPARCAGEQAVGGGEDRDALWIGLWR
jgi:hypothetical protein